MRSFSARVLLSFLLSLLLTLPALGNAAVYRGRDPIGVVSTADDKAPNLWVSVEDTASILGFSVKRSGDELILSRSDITLRLVTDAAAAWRDMYLVPLYAAPFERDGMCWIDEASAAVLFQRAVGSGDANRLRFRFIDAAPAPPGVSAAVAVPEERQPVQEQPQSVPDVPKVTVTKTPADASAAQPTVSAASPVPSAEPREQEKYETFRPDAVQQKTQHPSINGGRIQRLRWSASGGRIRAVVDADDGSDPQVTMDGGVVRALFASSVNSPEGIPAPFENVRAEIKNAGGGVEVSFSSNCTRVEKMVLDSPRRIVFDFFFPANTRIVASAVQKPAVPPSQAAVQTPSAPAQAAVPQQLPRTGSGRRVVVVDPGHGGKDPGTSANNVVEKNVNLAIGLELEKILKSGGFNVVMTRRTDVYLKLQERTDIANKADADLFVSIHVNALPSSKTASGFEIYLMALPTDKDALELAKIENREYVEGKSGASEAEDKRTEMLLRILGDMQQNNKISESTGLAEALFSAGRQNGLPMRRVAQAPFFVLRGAGMPAVLLETGFVTNVNEAKLLAHSGYQQRIAKAMAAGIVNYLK